MAFFSVIFFIINLIVVRSFPRNSKGIIGFPELEENPLIVNKQNRTPVFIPSMCSENELLYPGDQEHDWICDCRPGYLYHPNTDLCWPAYQKGPCPESQYLTLKQNSVQPICIENPCLTDTMVLWKDKCEKLGSIAPCGINKFPAETLWVNASTLEIECIQINNEYILSRSLLEDVSVNYCALGCKRYLLGKCTPSSNRTFN